MARGAGARTATLVAPAGARGHYLSGLALAAVGSVLFSAKAIIVKLGYRYGADPVTLIALRMLFALPFFVAVAAVTGRGPAQARAPGDGLRVFGMGVTGYYLASLLDFYGLRYISAGLERVILYLNPTLVVLISVLVLRKPIGTRQWVALAVAYAGVITVFSHDLRLSGENVPLGALLVFGSALSYAVYLVSAGELVARIGTMRLTAWASIVASLLCVAHALVTAPAALFAQPWAVYGLSLFNGVFCTVLPVFMVMMAIERIGSTAASQTGMVGPVATIAMAAVVLGEPVTGTQLVGTAIVMAGVFILTTGKN